jgi:hypothetical protein
MGYLYEACGCSTGDILDLECQSGSNTYNNSLVDINENDDSVFSIEDSLNGLRRLSYQAAIDNNEVIHKDSIGQDFVRDKKGWFSSLVLSVQIILLSCVVSVSLDFEVVSLLRGGLSCT